jgi:hypothetical protein
VKTSATLERGNADLRLDVSRLSATDRIQRLAAERGFAMPAPDDVGYLTAGDLARDGRRAARNMRPPDPRAADAAPSTAQPALPQPDSAVVTSGLGLKAGAPAPAVGGIPAPAGAGTATTPPATAAQPPPSSGGVAPSGATPSGGVAPPTQSGISAP